MNKLILLSAILLALCSCNKKKSESICEARHMPFDYANESKTLIPINTRNFWTYTDSLFDPITGLLVQTSTTLIKIEDVYELNDMIYFDFSELWPGMTIIGDTLFYVIRNEEVGSSDCYRLKKSYFPLSSDTVQYGDNPDEIAYRDTATVRTRAGDFSGNIVYEEGTARKTVFHSGIGMIRTSTQLANGHTRRSLTLKDYVLK